jgi:hypothetical protein
MPPPRVLIAALLSLRELSSLTALQRLYLDSNPSLSVAGSQDVVIVRVCVVVLGENPTAAAAMNGALTSRAYRLVPEGGGLQAGGRRRWNWRLAEQPGEREGVRRGPAFLL